MEEQGTTQASSGAAPTAGGSLKIRGKILLGFITILVLTIVIAAVALIGQRYTNKTVDQVINVQNKKAHLRTIHLKKCSGVQSFVPWEVDF